jgi:hypothetical protein
VEHGIRHPAGTYPQDLGWAAKPKVAADFVRNDTWREYFHQIAVPPSKHWTFGIEDILTTLPWGEKTLQLVAAGAIGGESPISRRKDGRHRVDGKTQRVARRRFHRRLGQSAVGPGTRSLDHRDHANGTSGMDIPGRGRYHAERRNGDFDHR